MALTVEINQLIKSLRELRFCQPMIECIINSLESNSNHITVKLFSKIREGTMIDDDRFIYKITIEDDGEGFTSENVISFKKYKTDYKIRLGCKGVGRLTWLKVFERADIESTIKENGKIIKKVFVFDETFDYGALPERNELTEQRYRGNKTSITLSGLRNENKSIPEKIKEIRDDVFVELLPKLLLIDRDFSIIFMSDRSGVEQHTITRADLPKLEKSSFNVVAASISKSFTLQYKLFGKEDIGNLTPKTYAYYCANQRIVESFRSHDLTVNLSSHENQHGIFLLESEYFNNCVNDARNKLEIDDRGLVNQVTWDHINDKLRSALKGIIYKKWPKLEEESIEDKELLASDHPHLSKYIRDFDNVGRVVPVEAIKIAKQRFEKDKRDIRSKYTELLRKHKIEDKDIDKFQELADKTTELGKQELAEYIWYRKIVIDIFERLLDSGKEQEKVVHDLIMPRGSKDEDHIEDNNLWLLDDKYSLYHYAASDIEIKQIYEDIFKEEFENNKLNDGGMKPDICVFFSEDRVDAMGDVEAVAIEFKAFNATQYQESKGLDQLLKYINAFQKRNTKVKRFWAYLIVDMDDAFEELLSLRGFKPMFTHEDKIYIQYIDTINTYITILPAKSIVADAKVRNHKFLKMIKGDFGKAKKGNDL